MRNAKICEEIVFPVEFYDVDSMRVVYHGNYVNYMEKGRCALLDKIGFGYHEMEKAGYMFPVVDIKVKYLHSLTFGDKVKVVAGLTEYENCIRIAYEIYNADTNELCTKAESTQMAVEIATKETKFVCPQKFVSLVNQLL